MKIVNNIKVNREKVKERIDSYITNKGYSIERMITSERFGLVTPNDLQPFAQSALIFGVGVAETQTLKKLFAPLDGVYTEGKKLFVQASVLTPKYEELNLKYKQEEQDLKKGYQNVIEELSRYSSEVGLLKRLLLNWKIKLIKDGYQRISTYASFRLPKSIAKDISLSALSNLYDWLQLGEEDPESVKASDELVHPFDLHTEEEISLLKIKKDLYKIKNHTAVVCLNQLKKYGLTLDTVVASELDRIPQEYMADVHSYGKLRTENSDSFGDGLFLKN